MTTIGRLFLAAATVALMALGAYLTLTPYLLP